MASTPRPNGGFSTRCSNPASQRELALSTQAPVWPGDAAICEKPPEGQAPRAGLEQKPFSPRRVQVSETADAKAGAVEAENGLIDLDLARVIEAWHTLSPDTRTALLAVVEAAQGR